MSTPQNYEETLLWKKAVELVQKIQDFRRNLPNPEMDIYSINSKLENSISELSLYLEESYRSKSKLAKDKNSFLAELALNECIENLKKANRLKFGEASSIIEDAEKFKKILNGKEFIFS
ncbi:MAG TPA: hypothetical protein PLU67_09160 [Candidatus Kapabacteria bacterium]|nr:hypothetical protein [Candidatus Kapabacteria bacterium]HOM05646.1 hypothetical protein [Candidatus Kapabacteria bacterium]HOQ49967.1 hypothetical protein [Candidatus Kapabacteria bacterium]